MSLLPQRKKSAEEIAKLRESFGIPGISPAETTAPATEAQPVDALVPAHHQATVVHEAEPVAAGPSFAHQGPKHVHSFKRSERIPDLPVADPQPAPDLQPQVTKLVRSLKKSEQGPVAPPSPTDFFANTKLPVHRHSDQELNEIRRREALAMLSAAKPDPKLAAAHPALLAPGYLLALTGTSCFFFYEFPFAATAVCSAAALFIAAYVFLRRPVSRHHAAFIAVIAFFVIIFATLHYFPHLQHAT